MNVYIEMERAIIKIGDIDIKKEKLHQHKRPVSKKNIDIQKVIIGNNVSFCKKGFKYFIGYKDAMKIRPLCILLPKMKGI